MKPRTFTWHPTLTLLTALLVLFTLLPFSLLSCGDEPEDSTTPLRFAALSGPTGMGLAKLISDVRAEGYSGRYQYVEFTDEQTAVSSAYASPAVAANDLLSGKLDVAALDTVTAAKLAKQSNGAFRIAAINTLGVLYVVENGNTITDLASLSGKTVAVPQRGGAPDFIFRYLLARNQIADVNIDYYSDPTALASAVTGGEVSIAVLPEPKVSQVCTGDVRVALNLSDIWGSSDPNLPLTQGCLVVRTEFADAHPLLLNQFLADYAASVAYITEPTRLEEAAALIAAAGIIPKAPLAKKALPRANIVCITGEDMETKLTAFYRALYEFDPSILGGSMPDESLFYIGANPTK